MRIIDLFGAISVALWFGMAEANRSAGQVIAWQISPMKFQSIFYCLAYLLFVNHAVALEPLDYKLRVPKEWSLHSGRVLTLDYEPHTVTRIRDRNMTLFEIRYPEVITQIIASERRQALLFLVARNAESGGFNYAYLMTLEDVPGQSLKPEKRLAAGSGPMTKRRWVVELGAVSDDAKIALLKIGEPDETEPPFKVGHIWETWDLVKPKLLKTGLSLGQ
jgi:hypothetical protein